MTLEEKTKLRKKFLKELKPILQIVDPIKKNLISQAIERIAFLLAELKYLEDEIDEKGSVELYENGKQRCYKQSGACMSYSSLFKNYTSLIREVANAIPKENKKEVKSTLASFLSAESK